MDASDTRLRLTDRKRAAVIGAAIEEFLAAGFDATSMDRIAARAMRLEAYGLQPFSKQGSAVRSHPAAVVGLE